MRNPCWQIDKYWDGLLKAVAHRDEGGNVCRVGIRTVVLAGREVLVGSQIRVGIPPLPHLPLDPV